MEKTRTLQLYKPHPLQARVHNSKARYRVLAAGRQVGKSTLCNNELIKKAWENPGTQYCFVSPIYSQAKEQFRRQCKTLPPEIIKKKSDTELRIELIQDSIVEYLSGDNPDSIRGKTYHGVVVDEVRDQDPQLWSMVLRPMLATTGGWAMFASTPSGFDIFYDLAQKAKADSTGEWEFFHAYSTANPLFTLEEFNRAKNEMNEAEFAQEILAEFRDLVAGKAYLCHGEWNKRTTSPFTQQGLISPHLPIIVGMDFNVGLMCWELGQTNREDFYFFDEIAIRNTHTQEQVKVLIEKVKDHKPGVILIGDATGNARKTASAGETDYTIIKNALTSAGIHWENRTPESNPLVKDRINAMNAKLKSASGDVHFFYHPTNCQRLGKDLDRVVWKEGASGAILDQTKDSELTHSSDAAGYPVTLMSRQFNPSPGTTRVIRRV